MIDGTYYCPFCGHALEVEVVRDDEGEVCGRIVVHDDAEHPVEALFDEEEMPQ